MRTEVQKILTEHTDLPSVARWGMDSKPIRKPGSRLMCIPGNGLIALDAGTGYRKTYSMRPCD